MRAAVASGLFGLVSGSADAAAWLTLHKILVANVTGDLVVLGAAWVAHEDAVRLGSLLAVPVFVAGVWLVRSMAETARGNGWPAIRLTMIAITALLAVFFSLGVTLGPFRAQNSPSTLIVGMVGVFAMSALNVVAGMWPDLATHTTAMTGNAARAMLNLAEWGRGEHQHEPELLRKFALPALVVTMFTSGCVLCALVYRAAGTWCMGLPLVFAVLMVALCPKEQAKASPAS